MSPIMQQQMMQFKFDEESNDEEANNTDSGINNNTKVVAVKRDLFVSSLPIDRGVDAPLRQSKGDWRTEASRRHTSSAYATTTATNSTKQFTRKSS